MSRIDTVVNVANLGFNIANFSQLRGIRNQAENQALQQELLKQLRSAVFNIKQAASQLEKEKPIAQAAALTVLLREITDYNISPDLFPDFQDKEYVLSVIGSVSDQQVKVMARLDSRGENILKIFKDIYFQMPDMEYYVLHHASAGQYNQAVTSNDKTLIWRVFSIVCTICAVYLLILMVSADSSTIVEKILFLAVSAVVVGGLAVSLLKSDVVGFHKNIIDSVRARVDMSRFSTLNDRFKGDVNNVSKKLEAVKCFVNLVYSGRYDGEAQTGGASNASWKISILCPSCMHELRVWMDDVGMEGVCPRCGNGLVIGLDLNQSLQMREQGASQA
jgi:hypothetical protein